MKPSLAKIYCDSINQATQKTGLGNNNKCSDSNENGDGSDTSNITPDNPFGDLDFAIFGPNEDSINNKRVGTIGVATTSGLVTGEDIENSGDTSTGGAIKISNLSDSGYTINRTYSEDIGEFMFLPSLTAKYGISKIEIEGVGILDVTDDKKMDTVENILKNSGVFKFSYGIYIGYKGFGESMVTKDNPISQKMIVTDTKGTTFTIIANVKVQ
ncbi:hypothetical protein [Enterococcus sp. DIV0210g]|jgi:hypothetical protein|uniref:hypothetical protein n=1 Tax=Enterococcus sp. DIV0210g TaxID=2774656 RepID=UPI003D2FF004